MYPSPAIIVPTLSRCPATKFQGEGQYDRLVDKRHSERTGNYSSLPAELAEVVLSTFPQQIKT